MSWSILPKGRLASLHPARADQLLLLHLLPMEHGPPIGLGLAAMELEEIADHPAEWQLVGRGREQPRQRGDRPLLIVLAARITLPISLFACGVFVPAGSG